MYGHAKKMLVRALEMSATARKINDRETREYFAEQVRLWEVELYFRKHGCKVIW